MNQWDQAYIRKYLGTGEEKVFTNDFYNPD